ncbi:MAG: site-2 protease family protein [Deltaproteobacteria bacterium]|nr:site-2 protease family protein [Deltaproteobacteria bacterium]
MFGQRITLFSLFGFEVRIDMSWFILAILIAWSLSVGFFPLHYKNLPTQTYWIMGAVGAAGIFISIIAHEISHSLVARKYGIPMKGITLFIFGGVAEMSEEPPNAKSEFLMAVVGPLSSFIISLGFYAIFRIGIASGWPMPVNGIVGYLAMINSVLAAFNLLPAFPLDGGRILRSALWALKKNLRWATRLSSQIGSFFGILMIIMGVFQVLRGDFIGGMWWFLIGMFLNSAAKASYQQLVTRKALEGETIQRFMKTDPMVVSPSLSIKELVENYIYQHHFKMFPVVESGKLIGCITTKQVRELPQKEWARKTVRELSIPCSPGNAITSQTDPVKAISIMSRTGVSRLMVVDNDRLVGIISLKDMLEFLSLKVELEN